MSVIDKFVWLVDRCKYTGVVKTLKIEEVLLARVFVLFFMRASLFVKASRGAAT